MGPTATGVGVLLIGLAPLVHGAADAFSLVVVPGRVAGVAVAATFVFPCVTLGCAGGCGWSAAQRGDDPPTLAGAFLAPVREA